MVILTEKQIQPKLSLGLFALAKLESLLIETENGTQRTQKVSIANDT